MGQIETKDEDNNTNNLSDRKEIIGKSRGTTASNDLNIKIDDNSDGNKDSDDKNNPKEDEKDKRLRKAKTYDFACNAFYGMVALLVFSTMSRTYTSYSGGGCGALYGAQPLLAYSCVGLACAIIKSLRKHIKEEIKENSNDLDKEETDEYSTEEVDPNGGKPYEISTLTTKEKLNTELNFPNNPKIGLPQELSNSIIVKVPVTKQMSDKLSTGLPLPQLPSPNSLTKRKVSFQTPEELSPLSAVDLKAKDTDLESFKNMINETHGSNPMIAENDWKDIKFDTEMFKHKDSHQKLEYNWKDYNLNSIDKY